MGKFAQGTYMVENAEKYAGTAAPHYRSSWELAFMRMCDQHPNIVSWASEAIKIPYMHPITGKYANYIPDFMIQYIDAAGSEHVELIEIKPSNQTTMENANSRQQKASVIINAAKWTAAQEWCQRRGIRFKVINEDQIFTNTKKRKSKSRTPKVRKT
jgi:hypothetical protein